jgi:hypothetical protein
MNPGIRSVLVISGAIGSLLAVAVLGLVNRIIDKARE